jgi:hypothetical protein
MDKGRATFTLSWYLALGGSEFLGIGSDTAKMELQAGLEIPTVRNTGVQMQFSILHLSIGLHTKFQL